MTFRQYLTPGEAVEDGGGPIHCAGGDRSCGGFVGMAGAGAVLVAVFDSEDARFEVAERGLWAMRCARCGRLYAFRAAEGVPKAA